MRILFLLILPFYLSSNEMLTRTQAIMNTFVDITLPEKKQIHFEHAFSIIKALDHLLSTYDIDAHLYTLNRTKSIPSHPVLVDVITKNILYYTQTNGYFDISIGALTKDLYHFGEDVASPSKKALQEATLNIKGIHLSPKTISLDENITLDMGGMGKGYGVDSVATFLEEQNITEGRIALSGDIRCLDHCEIYIQSPLGEEMFAKVQTQAPHVSISTSGVYRRYATKKEEHHLLDPKQRAPEKNFLSVSLFSVRDNSRLDAFATAVSVMPLDLAFRFLKKHKDISFILVKSDGEIYYNDSAKILNFTWLPHNEVATIQTSKESKEANKNKANTLTHPNTSHPIEIKK